MQKLVDQADHTQAIANSAGIGGGGALVGTKVNATGYGRARFIFSFGANSNTSAALSSNIAIWAASTSGATFTQITGAVLAAVSSGVLSNNVMAIDVAVPPTTPWLQVSGNIISTAIAHSATVDLYRMAQRPDTDGYQQVVSV